MPSLPVCITFGETVEEAKMVRDAIEAYLKSVEKQGEEVLDDSNTFEGVLTLRYACDSFAHCSKSHKIIAGKWI
ncbi:MAG: type II toxin-antitoxin system HicB family antitoxin [Thermodesulfovibrionales bacterium]